jgi:hypothetical protein
METMLTLKELRETARVSRATAWRWRQVHGLPVVQIGGVTRVRRTDWLAFIQNHRKAATR